MSPQTPGALATYESFAPFYDRFTADHDYEAWTRSLEALATSHGLAGTRLLDVACGTGKSFLPFLRRGYRVVACDLSPGMLERAAAKADAELLLADMRDLPRMGVFDLITCLDDSLNYLLDEEDLLPAFRSAAANLAPGGVYVFDLNTIETYRSIFGTVSHSEDEDSRFAWRGEARDPGPGGLASATIESVERDGGRWRRSTCRHTQRHHPEETVRRALALAGLDCIGPFGQFRDGRLEPECDEERHTKAIYVATARRRRR